MSGNLLPQTNPLGYSLEYRNLIQGSRSIMTLDKLEEVDRVVNEIVNNLDDVALKELTGGSIKDIDKIIDIMYEETYGVLYGSHGMVKESSYLYLEKLTDSIEETMRIENLNYFILSTLPEFDFQWFHYEWGQFAMRYRKLCLIAARDHGKSFWLSYALPLWRLYRYKPASQFLHHRRKDLVNAGNGFIISNELDLAKTFLESIKESIEDNPILHERLFPVNKEKWGAESIRCRNGAKLKVKSYGSSFRGRHPGWICVDDFLKDNVLHSETQRKKATDYFHSVIMNAVVPGGDVDVAGTPFHEADLYGDLKQKPGWHVFEYPSIFPSGELLYPDRHTFESLMEKRKDQGNIIFSRENLCRPIVSDSSLFPYDLMRRSFFGMDNVKLVNNRDSFAIKKIVRVVVGADFAMSSSVGADYSCFTVWGIDESDTMYLMSMWREKGKSFAQQIAVLKRINADFRPDVMFLESNQFQQIFTDEAANSGLPVHPQNTGTNKNDLRNGWPGLVIRFEQNRIKFPRGDEYSRNITDIIASEFTSIAWTDKGIASVGAHDDTCSSTWLADCASKFAHSSGFGLTFLD